MPEKRGPRRESALFRQSRKRISRSIYRRDETLEFLYAIFVHIVIETLLEMLVEDIAQVVAAAAGQRGKVGALEVGSCIWFLLAHHSIEHLEDAAAFLGAETRGAISVFLLLFFGHKGALHKRGRLGLETGKHAAVLLVAVHIPSHKRHTQHRDKHKRPHGPVDAHTAPYHYAGLAFLIARHAQAQS